MPWAVFNIRDEHEEIIEKHLLPCDAGGVPRETHNASVKCDCNPRYTEDEAANIVYVHQDPLEPLTDKLQ